MLRFFFARCFQSSQDYKRTIENRFAELFANSGKRKAPEPAIEVSYREYVINSLDRASMELYILSNSSKHEESLILSGTCGDYYALMRNYYETHKPEE